MREQVRQTGVPTVDEIGAEADAGRLDFLLNRDHGAAGEILAAIFEACRVAGGAEPIGKAPIGQVLGVDQNPVAIENDEFG
ncbi:hypothetical protein MesoLjLa_01470 [Mesorhizobium sp. L-2-11]|nr:hypothetical protein MesoLjLa_01470 [Mesorhizobium sp. L-2-11]